jgi:hypothetical protein
MPEKVKARFIDPMLLLKTEKLGTQLGEQEAGRGHPADGLEQCSVPVVKSGAEAGVASGASAAPMVGACFRNRRIQNWPRW